MYFAFLKSSHATQKLSHLDTLACLPYTYVTFKDLKCKLRVPPEVKKDVFLAFLQ